MAGEDRSPKVGDLVGDAWLRALDRLGDDDAYLAYAQKTHHHGQRILRLIALGRVAAAIEDARVLLVDPADVADVVRGLVEHGSVQEALSLGLECLDRVTPDAVLLTLLAELADELGEVQGSLRLYIASGWALRRLHPTPGVGRP